MGQRALPFGNPLKGFALEQVSKGQLSFIKTECGTRISCLRQYKTKLPETEWRKALYSYCSLSMPPHMGFKAYMETYSGYDPAWKLACCPDYWIRQSNRLKQEKNGAALTGCTVFDMNGASFLFFHRALDGHEGF